MAQPGRGVATLPRVLWPHPFADVYFAHERKPARLAAILRLESSDVAGTLQGIERAAKQLETIDSAHVAKIRGIEHDPITRRVTVLTDPIAGLTAAQTRDRGVLAVDQLFSCLGQVASALVQTHRAGLLHLALGPASVIISVTGEVRVTDFGLAGLLPAQPRNLRLHPFSPEAVLGLPRGPAEDVYLFGALAYYLVSGAPPLVDDDVARLRRRHAIEDPPPLTDAPPPLAEFVARCLAKEPEDRFDDMTALVAELDAVARAVGSAPLPAAPARPVVARPSRGAPIVGAPAQPRTVPARARPTPIVPPPSPAAAVPSVVGPGGESTPIHIELIESTPVAGAPAAAMPAIATSDAAAFSLDDDPPAPAISAVAVPTFIAPESLPPRPVEPPRTPATTPPRAGTTTDALQVAAPDATMPSRRGGTVLRLFAIVCVLGALGGGLWLWSRIAGPEATAPAVTGDADMPQPASPPTRANVEPEPGAASASPVPIPASTPSRRTDAAIAPAIDPQLDAVVEVVEDPADAPSDAPVDLRVSTLLAQAKAARRQGRAADAVAHYKDALAVEPQNVEALSTLARLAFDRGDFREAVVYGKRTVAQRPSSGKARIALGDAYFKQGDRRHAEEQYRRAKSLGYDLAKRRLDMLAGR